MATTAPAAGKRASSVQGPHAAGPKAGARARPRAQWTFDGGAHGPALQAKMEVSQPEDTLEREADRVAAHVVQTPSPAAAPPGKRARPDEMDSTIHRKADFGVDRDDDDHPGARAQRMCADCHQGKHEGKNDGKDEEHHKKVHRRADDAPAEHVQRLPQTQAHVTEASLADDREERTPRAQRKADERDEHETEHRTAHRMADDEDKKKKVHRDAAPERGVDEDAALDVDGARSVRGVAPGASEAGPEFEGRLRLQQMQGGAPLPGELRAFMEPRLRADLGRVRIHADSNAAALAKSVQARAFTVGRHIFFAPGQFRPQTQQGRKLVAHELTHVLQQRGGLHSVQREVMDAPRPAEPETAAEKQTERAEKATDAAAPDTVDVERLERIFNLREGVTPQLVLDVIRELLRATLRILPRAEKLLPFVDPSRATDRTVRRWLRSRSHELRLEASQVGGGDVATKWELRFLDGTRVPATGGQSPGGTDEDAIEVGSTGRPTTPADPAADVRAEAKQPGPLVEEAPASPGGAAPEPASPEAGAPKTPAAAPEGEGAAKAAGPAAGEEAAAEAPAAGAAAAEPAVPKKPEDDPNFQAVKAGAKQAGKQTAQHGDSDTAAANAEEAAPVEPGEKVGLAQNKQVETMNAQETPEFDRDAFVREVLKKVAETTPKDLEEARNFKRDNKVGVIRDSVRGVAGTEAEQSRAPLKQATAQEPKPNSVTARTAAELKPAPLGDKPADIDAARAVPPAEPKSAVEGAIAKNKTAADAKMKELGVPDAAATLAKSNEPAMLGALEAKKAFDADAAAAPAKFRADEGQARGAAQKENAKAGTEGLSTMFGTRSGLIKQVQKGQTGGKQKSETQHQTVTQKVGAIYAQTKTKVETRLGNLQKAVFEKFDRGSQAAMDTFATQVSGAESRWKDKSFLERGAEWLASKVGIPTELEADLSAIRQAFIEQMRHLVVEIATLVSSELKKAKDDVKQGRDAINVELGKLGPGQQKLKEQLGAEFDGKFKGLEGEIAATRTGLIAGIAARYKQRLEEGDKLLGEVRERNKTFLDELADAFKDVIKTWGDLKDKLLSVFHEGVATILRILADPITFARNLFAGVVQGFKSFLKNIVSHLGHGVIDWLTGTVSQAGIELPPKLDAEGILSLFLQITGISIAHVKERARVIWGDKVVDFIEKVVSGGEQVMAGVEEAIDIFRVLQKEGIAGLVRLLKDKIIALKDQALDQIKQALAVEVIAAAIQNLLSLLTPASALVQAVIKIVNVILFFIQNASRIADLISTITTAANDILSGNIGGVAAKVESALASTIPIVIDFLASLIGIGSKIVNTIKKAIEFVRGAVDKAIDAVLNFLKKIALKILGALGLGPKEKPKPKEEEPEDAAGPGATGAIGISLPFTVAGQQHTLFIRETENDAEARVSSTPETLDAFLQEKSVVESSDPETRAKVHALGQKTNTAAKRAKAATKSDHVDPGKVQAATVEVAQDEQSLAGALNELAPSDSSARFDVAATAIQAELEEMAVLDEEMIQKAIPGWIEKFKFKTLSVTTEGDHAWVIEGEMSPQKRVAKVQIPGTFTNPFMLDWPKPASANYTTLYFGGRVAEARSQSVMAGLAKQGKNVGGEPVRAYRPHDIATLPGAAEPIGITPENRIALNSVIGPLSTEGTQKGALLLNILKRYGYRAAEEGFEGDHIREAQFGGPHVVGNIWPLEQSINSVAGPTLQGAKATYPKTGKEVPLRVLKQRSRKYFFKIVSVISR